MRYNFYFIIVILLISSCGKDLGPYIVTKVGENTTSPYIPEDTTYGVFYFKNYATNKTARHVVKYTYHILRNDTNEYFFSLSDSSSVLFKTNKQSIFYPNDVWTATSGFTPVLIWDWAIVSYRVKDSTYLAAHTEEAFRIQIDSTAFNGSRYRMKLLKHIPFFPYGSSNNLGELSGTVNFLP